MAMSIEKQKQIHKQRRKQILDVAYTLFYKNGYSNTTVTDIAKTAGISKGLIYRYFNTKEDILFASNNDTLKCLDSFRNDPSPKHALYEYTNLSFTNPLEIGYIGQLRLIFIAILKGEVKNDTYNIEYVQQFGKNFFTPIFKKGQELGEFKNGDPQLFADIYWHYILGYLMYIVNNDEQFPPLPDASHIVSIFET